MAKYKLPYVGRQSGFTIIEVMIVLAIAGLILLIVFLVVPALQRNARNYDRKDYTGQIYTALDEYKNTTGHYPGATFDPYSDEAHDDICKFLHGLPRVSPDAPCNNYDGPAPGPHGAVNADCMTVSAGPYTLCFQNRELVRHNYIGPLDEISMTLAHWCNVPGHEDFGEPSWYPIAGNDDNTRRFVVWTKLENVTDPLCLDNYPSSITP